MSYSQGGLFQAGKSGETKPAGNTELIDYGIYNEGSDIRAHVCVEVKRLYVYPTASGVKAIESGVYPLVPVNTSRNGQRIKTAEGYIIPPDDIEKCVSVRLWPWTFARWPILFTDSTSKKGDHAVQIVKAYLEKGGFPLMVNPDVIGAYDLQIDGTDIIVDAQFRIQVKCDFFGGPKEWGGTGNLFLQTAECNPWREY